MQKAEPETREGYRERNGREQRSGYAPGEEPVEKVDGRYRYADAEHDSGEHALVPAFAEGEHQNANDDGDEIEALGNRPEYERTQEWTSIDQAVAAPFPFIDKTTAAAHGFDTNRVFEFQPFTPVAPNPLGEFIGFNG
jgi:hypothetical protein